MIEHQQVFWSGQYLAPDSGDPGIEPDSGHLEGEVTFTPVWDASVYGLLSDATRSTYIKPFPFSVVDGQLMSDDDGEMVPGVRVPASVGGHPVNWVARFNLSAGGDPITVRELRFTSNPGGDVHLHNVIPSDAIYPQLPQDIVKGDSVTDIYTQGQYVVFIVGEPPRTTQHVLAFPGTAEAVAAAEAAVLDMESLRDAAEAHITQVRSDAEAHIGQVRTDTLVTINAAGVQASESRDDALAYRNAAEGHAQTATDAAAAALDSEEAAETARGAAATKAGEASSSAAAASTAKDEAEAARATSVTKAGEASSSAAAALASKDESATKAGEASSSADAAATAKDEAAASAGAAADSAEAAELARSQAGGYNGAASRSATAAATSAGEASDSAAAAQALHDDVAAAVAQFDVDFAADMALFTGIRDDINLVANEVANDANRAEDAAQQAEDALTVVRAHRWVPQGRWEYDLDYSAGDVVAHDGGSYYAQEDIPAGVEPPGGNWMVLGQGGITDAAELTGALTEYVDSSQAIVNLGSYVPGVEPEFQAAQLVAILGHLYLSLESSVEAGRVTGALTDQVDVSNAEVEFQDPLDGTQFTSQLSALLRAHHSVVAAFSPFSDAVGQAIDSKSDVGHTHDGADITGALTDQVDAGAATVTGTPPGESEPITADLNTVLSQVLFQNYAIDSILTDFESKSDVGHTHTIGDTDGLQAALDGKSATGHTHTWSQISDAPSYSKDMIGDNLVQRNASGHINVPSGAGPLNAPRRLDVDAAINAKIQLVTEFPASPVAGVLYLKAE